MNRTIQVGGVYRHFKGFMAKVIILAKHTETGEMLVVYECIDVENNGNHKDHIYMPVQSKCFYQKLTMKNIPIVSRNIDSSLKYKFEFKGECDEK